MLKAVATPVLLVAMLGAPSIFAQATAAPVRIASGEQSLKAVTVKLTQFKVIKTADGKESLVDAATVKPGDVVEYRAVYINNANVAVKNLAGKLPIPQGLEYLPKSATPGAFLVQAATRNGVFSAEPLLRQVAGKTEPVPYSEYRMLRWNLGQLPPGGEAVVSARARVETYVAPVASAGLAQTSIARISTGAASRP